MHPIVYRICIIPACINIKDICPVGWYSVDTIARSVAIIATAPNAPLIQPNELSNEKPQRTIFQARPGVKRTGQYLPLLNYAIYAFTAAQRFNGSTIFLPSESRQLIKATRPTANLNVPLFHKDVPVGTYAPDYISSQIIPSQQQ